VAIFCLNSYQQIINDLIDTKKVGERPTGGYTPTWIYANPTFTNPQKPPQRHGFTLVLQRYKKISAYKQYLWVNWWLFVTDWDTLQAAPFPRISRNQVYAGVCI